MAFNHFAASDIKDPIPVYRFRIDSFWEYRIIEQTGMQIMSAIQINRNIELSKFVFLMSP